MHTTMSCTLWQLLVGCKLPLRTIDNSSILVTIPPGLAWGTQLRLAGLGGYDAAQQRRGDLFISVQIIMPQLSEQQTQIIQNWIHSA